MVKAIARYVRMSPSKVRRVLNQIRGKSYEEALLILECMPYFACKPILRVLQSAGANALYNENLKKTELFISEVYVDAGPVRKKIRPRAQGRASVIQKATSHISVCVLKRSYVVLNSALARKF